MFSSITSKHFFLKTGLVSLLSLTSIFGASQSSAAVLDGGFESCNFIPNQIIQSGDCAGWETFGRTFIETADYGSGPTQGNYQVRLDTITEQTGNFLELAQFLSLGVSDLQALGNGDVYEGSAIKTSLAVEAGDILTFDWNFLTDDFRAEDFNDFAFVTLSQTTGELADTLSPLVQSLTEFRYETGFNSFSYTFTTAGTYTLGVAVVDVFDLQIDSALLIDNVSVSSLPPSSSIPEPSSLLALLAFGAFGAGWRLLRQR